MPHRATMLPSDRVFARLEKFEVSCPNCRQMITSWHDQKNLPASLQDASHLRAEAKRRMSRHHKTPSLRKLTWNPLTHRLKCPHCGKAYICGLLLFGLKRGSRFVIDPPPDTVPTRSERLELARLTGGWYAEEIYQAEQSVNHVIDGPCTCPVKGWAVGCPVHGDPASGASGRLHQGSGEEPS